MRTQLLPVGFLQEDAHLLTTKGRSGTDRAMRGARFCGEVVISSDAFPWLPMNSVTMSLQILAGCLAWLSMVFCIINIDRLRSFSRFLSPGCLALAAHRIVYNKFSYFLAYFLSPRCLALAAHRIVYNKFSYFLV
jgi:hypothetical protein